MYNGVRQDIYDRVMDHLIGYEGPIGTLADEITEDVMRLLESDFRDIPGFPNYIMNGNGGVKNKTTKAYLKSSRDGCVTLYKDGRQHRRSIRKLYRQIYPNP